MANLACSSRSKNSRSLCRMRRRALGWDLRAWQDRRAAPSVFHVAASLAEEPGGPAGPLSDLFIEKNIKRVVLDSVTHFTRLTNEQQQLRHIYNRLINALKREGATSLLLAEEGRLEAQRVERGALSFVVDSILLLRYVEVESAIQRAIAVMKMRGSDHVKEIRRYEIRKGGLVVTGPFEGSREHLDGYLASRQPVSLDLILLEVPQSPGGCYSWALSTSFPLPLEI